MNLYQAVEEIKNLSQSDNDYNAPSKMFEKACFVLAQKWADEELAEDYSYSFSYRVKRPIDITITVTHRQLPNGLGKKLTKGKSSNVKKIFYFMECKFYGRSLGLETLGKSYLMAIRYKPKELIIVSNSYPTDTAIEFAQWVGDQFDNNVEVSYWNPLDVEWVPQGFVAEGEQEEYLDRFVQPFEIHSWTLWRTSVFDFQIISDSEVFPGLRVFSLLPNDNLTFNIKLISPKSFRDQIQGEVVIEGEGSTVKFNLIQHSSSGRFILAKSVISAVKLKIGIIYRIKVVRIISKSGEDILTISENCPKLQLSSEFVQFSELRDGKAEEVYSLWKKNRDKKIIVVKGEGGVGKSHLCEKIGYLSQIAGYDIAKSTLSMETGIGFVSEFLWLLLPKEVRREMKSFVDVSLTEEFINIFVSKFEKSNCEKISKLLAQLLLKSRWPSEDLELVMQTIARLLVGSTRPLIFLLSNCHRIADTPAFALKSLLAAIEQEGWGNINIILEARDTFEDIGSNWKDLLYWINRGMSHRCMDVKLMPLTKNELKEPLMKIIISEHAIEISELIFQKAGGNPLYLNNLFRSLVDEKALLPVVVDEEISFSCENIEKLNNLVVHMSDDVEMLLCERINYIHRKNFTKDEIGAFVIGLNAIFSSSLSLNILSVFFSTSHSKIENILIRFKNSGILVRVDDNFFSFSHEFSRSAALKWFLEQPESSEIAIGVIETNGTVEYAMLMAKARINKYLERFEHAIFYFNAAVQLSDGDFGMMLPCYQEIAECLYQRKSEQHCISYHAAIEKVISIGYYILGRNDIISLNKIGLNHIAENKDLMPPRLVLELRRYYNHAISSVSLHLLDWKLYKRHASEAIDFCCNKLELAQVLNRVVKFSAMTGEWRNGFEAGVLATKLQEMIDLKSDMALPNVLYGEMATLYSQFDLNSAVKIVEKMLLRKVDERQRAHDLIVAASVYCTLGNNEFCMTLLKEANFIISKIGLERLKSNFQNIEAVMNLKMQNNLLAADSFKKISWEAALRDNIRDEIKFSNNLLISYLVLERVDKAQDVYEKIISIIKSKIDNSILSSDEILSKASNLVKEDLMNSDISSGEVAIYPEPPVNVGGNYFSIFLNNAGVLCEMSPQNFTYPAEMLNENSLEFRPIPINSVNIYISSIGASLKAIC